MGVSCIFSQYWEGGGEGWIFGLETLNPELPLGSDRKHTSLFDSILYFLSLPFFNQKMHLSFGYLQN